MRTLLFILIAFVAVTATVSGILLMANPDGRTFNMPLTLLNGTPFKSFLIPGMILTIAVGAVNMLAFFHYYKEYKYMYDWTLAGGIMLTLWSIVQMILLQSFFWLQIFYLGIGILIILLSFQLKGKWII